MKIIDKVIVDHALAANKELSTELREAAFIPIFGSDISCLKDKAFMDCHNMVIKKIPEHISALEDSVFMNCQKIEKFSLPNISCIGKQLFAGCTSLSAFEFTESNLSIGQYAFDKTALSVVKLPDAMDKIDQYAFTNCSSLVSASGNNVVSALYGAFQVCPQLSAIDFPKLKFLGYLSFVDTGFKSLELNSVEQIEDRAFNRARNLETVSFPNCLSAGEYYSDALFNGNWYSAYNGFPVLREIKFPKLVQLRTGVGVHLSALSSVDLQSLERIEFSEMFNDCPNLSTISLPKLNYAGGAIACDCISLNTLELPELSMLNSYNRLAYYCSALTGVAIPKISSLGDGLFEECMNVASVYIDNGALHSISDGQIITPTSADNEWKWISPKIDHIANDRIVELPNGDYAKNLKYIDCASVTCCHIEFDGNTNLQFVNLPALSVVDMGFDDCQNLLSLDFSGAKYLFCLPDDPYYCSYSLRNCTKLSAIKVSDELRMVGLDSDMFADTELYKKQVAEGKQIFKLNDAVCIQCLDPELQTYSDPVVKLIGPDCWYDLGSTLTARK